MPTEPNQMEATLVNPTKRAIISACPASKLCVDPHKTDFGTFASYPATTGELNHLNTYPVAGQCLFMLQTGGYNNLAFRPWLVSNSGTLTVGTDKVTTRWFGFRPLERFRQNNDRTQAVHSVSGTWLGDVDFGLATKLALGSSLAVARLPSTGVADSSWSDLVSVVGTPAHSGFNTVLGATGAGRWLRIFDLLGFPFIGCYWNPSAANIGFNAEWYAY